VVHLNFSHGNSEEHLARAKKVRELARNNHRHIAILVDLQGLKIRIKHFKNSAIKLKNAKRPKLTFLKYSFFAN
jgi:pyruvate kinase